MEEWKERMKKGYELFVEYKYIVSGSSGKQVLLVAHLSATLPFLLTYRIIVFFKVLS